MMKNKIAQRRGYLFALGAVLIWTGFIVVSRLGGISQLLPNDVIAIRYATCALLLLPVWWFKFRFNLLNPKIICSSLIGGIAYASCAFRGFELAPASHAAVLLPGLMPLFITLLSRFIFKDHIKRSSWVGVGVITLGVFALLGQNQSSNTASIIGAGQLWLIFAAFFWALFSVLVKHWKISPWEATISLALITAVIYLPIYFVALPSNISLLLWRDVLTQAFYQGFLATIIQMLLYVRAVHIIGPTSMGTMMASVPILASISAIIFLNEPSSIFLATGVVLVSIGSWISYASPRINQEQFNALRKY
ncbi:MAG: DMT family transporter [Pseudomonadales bacterium]|nr:DMT family transporter [Pseudomonadales bacterium]